MKSLDRFVLASLVAAPVLCQAHYFDRAEAQQFLENERLKKEEEARIRTFGRSGAAESCDENLVQPAYLPPTPYVNDELELRKLWLAQPTAHREFLFRYILRENDSPPVSASDYRGSKAGVARKLDAERAFAEKYDGWKFVLQNTREYLDTLRGTESIYDLDLKQITALTGLQALVRMNGPQILLRQVQKVARAREIKAERATYRKNVIENSRAFLGSFFGRR